MIQRLFGAWCSLRFVFAWLQNEALWDPAVALTLSLHRGQVLTEILCCCIWIYKTGNYSSNAKTVLILITSFLEWKKKGKSERYSESIENGFRRDSWLFTDNFGCQIQLHASVVTNSNGHFRYDIESYFSILLCMPSHLLD